MCSPQEEFSQIKNSDALFLIPDEVSKVLGLSPQGIRNQARADPLKLGFPVIISGNKVRIPRAPFIRFIEEGRAE